MARSSAQQRGKSDGKPTNNTRTNGRASTSTTNVGQPGSSKPKKPVTPLDEAEPSVTAARRAKPVIDHDAQDELQPGKKRKSLSNNDGDDSFVVPVLKQRIKKVDLETIETKWDVFPNGCPEAVTLLENSLKYVLSTIRTGKDKMEAQQILRKAVEKCERRMNRIPVPPGSKDRTFSYEYLYDENQKLEAIRNAEKRELADLDAEIHREMSRQERNNRALQALKDNAKGEDQIRRDRAKTLLPGLKSSKEDEDVKLENANFRLLDQSLLFAAAPYDLREDKDIMSLNRKLENHMESMQNNQKPLADVSEWMQQTRASVDDLLYKTGKYEVLAEH